MAYVYRHIRLDKNEPFYIGISKNIYRPYETKNRNKYWNNIVNKSEYSVDILFDNLSYEKAKEKEKEFIYLYGRSDLKMGCLVNATDGGEGTINIVVNQKTRKLISEARKGKKRTPMTEETKAKISQTKKGVKQSKESVENRIKARLKSCYRHSQEIRDKISDTKIKNGSPQSKVVLNFTTGIYYKSAKDASDLLRIPLITVYRLCKGQAKSVINNLKYI